MTIEADFLSGGAVEPASDFTTSVLASFEAAQKDAGGTAEPPADDVAPEVDKADDDAPEATEDAPEENQEGNWWENLSKDEWDALRANKAGKSFAAVRAEAKAAKAEAARLQAELEKFQDVNLDEITSLKTKYQSQEAKIAAVRLEETERYDTEIRQPMSGIVQALDRLGGDELIAILEEHDIKERDAKLSVYLDTAPSVTGRKVENLFSKFDELAERQAAMRANAVEELKKAQEEEGRRTSEMTAKQRAAYEGEADKLWEILKKQQVPTNLLTDKLLGEVKREDVAKLNPLTQAFAIASTKLLPHLNVLLQERDTEIKSLKETVAKLQGASPTPGSKPGSARPSADKSFIKAVLADFER